MRDLLARTGLAKYDASHPRLDAGVLSIRDFILGMRADWLVTCRGHGSRDCGECFRANSYFTKKLLDTRAAAQRPSFSHWLSVTAADLASSVAADGGSSALERVDPAAPRRVPGSPRGASGQGLPRGPG